MLVRVFILLLVGLAHLVAAHAALVGLLTGIVACVVLCKWMGINPGLIVGLAVMLGCSMVGYAVQQLLPAIASDTDALERWLGGWAEPPSRPRVEEPFPDAWWTRR